MSQYRIMDRKNRTQQKSIGDFCCDILQFVTIVYILAMLLIYPLYYQDKYYNMGDAKYYYFKMVSLIFIGLLMILQIGVSAFKITKKEKSRKLRWSITDGFVFAYGMSVWVSFFLSPYKSDAIWGYQGWYMGIVSQMIFVAIYFFVSRYGKLQKWMLHAICFVSSIVFLLAVLHRFQIDPLGMYEGLSIDNMVLFLTTMGQATWYSSYLCIVFPIGLYFYWNSEKRLDRILYGCYIALGFATMVTQNSDSAFMAFGLIFLVLFLYSFQSNDKMKRFLESLVIGLISARIIGVLQQCFKDRVVPLESFSIEASQGRLTEIVLLFVVVIYILFCICHKKNWIQIVKWKKAGIGLAVLAVFSIMLMVGCIVLNAKGALPAGLSGLKKFEYFTFNDDWGNGRGFTWRCCAEIFREYPMKNKLFGCGPDCFASYAYDRYANTISARFGDKVLTNAHNEWFTSLLFFGVFGFLAYFGIFVSQAVSCGKKVLQQPILLAALMSITAYFGHNFFCYQQVICTPVIFILIGYAEYLQREKRN